MSSTRTTDQLFEVLATTAEPKYTVFLHPKTPLPISGLKWERKEAQAENQRSHENPDLENPDHENPARKFILKK
jgi:hypothetical protein